MRAAPQHFGIHRFQQRVRAQTRRQSLSFASSPVSFVIHFLILSRPRRADDDPHDDDIDDTSYSYLTLRPSRQPARNSYLAIIRPISSYLSVE
jgi:hypothetical protein